MSPQHARPWPAIDVAELRYALASAPRSRRSRTSCSEMSTTCAIKLSCADVLIVAYRFSGIRLHKARNIASGRGGSIASWPQQTPGIPPSQ